MTEHDPELSQAYRDAEHPEPPAVLDARILAAARQSVRPLPRRRPGWFGWAIPMSTTAVLVLGVSLLFRIQQEAPETLRDIAPSPASPTAPAAALPPPATPDQTSRAVRLAPRRSEKPPVAQPEAADSLATVPEREAAREAPVVATHAVESQAMPAQADQARTAAPAPAASNLDTARADRPRPPAAAPAFLSKRKANSAVDDGPAQQVEQIRRLLREGRIEEARKTLDELRDRYPAFVLPDDLSEARCCRTSQGNTE